ncbi:unnamed protein product, partial [Amoebophrya sp. A120]|eukprot:GSA120T00001025001.1
MKCIFRASRKRLRSYSGHSAAGAVLTVLPSGATASLTSLAMDVIDPGAPCSVAAHAAPLRAPRRALSAVPSAWPREGPGATKMDEQAHSGTVPAVESGGLIAGRLPTLPASHSKQARPPSLSFPEKPGRGLPFRLGAGPPCRLFLNFLISSPGQGAGRGEEPGRGGTARRCGRQDGASVHLLAPRTPPA